MLLQITSNGLLCAAAVIGILYLFRHAHEQTHSK